MWTIDAPIFIIPTIFMSDALSATTLLVYPGLGQASSMLGCIPSGLFTTVTGEFLPHDAILARY